MFKWRVGIWLYPLMISIISTIIFYIVEKLKYPKSELYKDDYKDVMSSIFGICFIILLILSFFGILDSLFHPKEISQNKFISKTSIVYSLNDNNDIHGSLKGNFLYASGKINSVSYYYAMVGNDKDGYVITKFNSNDTYIHFSKKLNPKYEETSENYIITQKKNFIFGIIFKPFKDKKGTKIIKKDLYLPKNAIKINYKIDLK